STGEAEVRSGEGDVLTRPFYTPAGSGGEPLPPGSGEEHTAARRRSVRSRHETSAPLLGPAPRRRRHPRSRTVRPADHGALRDLPGGGRPGCAAALRPAHRAGRPEGRRRPRVLPGPVPAGGGAGGGPLPRR